MAKPIDPNNILNSHNEYECQINDLQFKLNSCVKMLKKEHNIGFFHKLKQIFVKKCITCDFIRRIS